LLLSAKEKEDLVIDLLKKDCKAREIAKITHVSFTYIKKIRMKLTGEVNENLGDDAKNKPLTLPSQAFKLFLEGKSIVHVAIELDLPTDQVLKIHSDYLTLQNRQEVVSILDENRNNLKGFLEIFRYLKENRVSTKDFEDIVEIKNNIDDYKRERDKLELDNFNAKGVLKYHQLEINEIKNKRYNY
jgi:hypothetical protein